MWWIHVLLKFRLVWGVWHACICLSSASSMNMWYVRMPACTCVCLCMWHEKVWYGEIHRGWSQESIIWKYPTSFQFLGVSQRWPIAQPRDCQPNPLRTSLWIGLEFGPTNRWILLATLADSGREGQREITWMGQILYLGKCEYLKQGVCPLVSLVT